MYSYDEPHLLTADIPDEWMWVKEIIDEAHLPNLGLPVKWDTTQKKQINIVFDPITNNTINLTTGEKKFIKNPVRFIKSTPGTSLMPGSQAPDAVRYSRYMEPALNENIVKGAHKEELVPCIAHGDYVKVEALQSDHMQAKEQIRKRQIRLVEKLNEDTTFANFVMELDGIDKFFVKVKEQYYGTLFFYQLYFNDIDNIWLICEACNLHKSNHNTVAWLKEQWLYGDEFLDYLGKIRDNRILTKAKDNKGLAQITIDWFWNRHAHYISIAKKLMENVVTPIQILNQKVDHTIGLARDSGSERRMKRHMASLDFRLALLNTVANLQGIDMPKAESESLHSSSDEEAYLNIRNKEGKLVKPKLEDYMVGTKRVSEKLPTVIQKLLTDSLRPEIKKQRKRPFEKDAHQKPEYKRFKSM